MYCKKCGCVVNVNDKFCSRCGASVEELLNAVDGDVTFHEYLQLISQRLDSEGEFIAELHAQLFVTKRMSGALAVVHQYFFVMHNNQIDGMGMKEYSVACTTYALKNYSGVPRGMQKSIAIYPIVCQKTANQDAIAYTKIKPEMHLAALKLPVVVDLSTKELHYMSATPLWGMALWRGIKKNAVKVLG